MADPTAKLLQSLVLSAADLRSLTDWDDAIIEEWLNLFRNLITLANGVDDAEAAGTAPQSQSVSILYDLRAQLGSGNPLTSDETGFTVDSTNLSVDQDEA
jgi:hypothetical protein